MKVISGGYSLIELMVTLIGIALLACSAITVFEVPTLKARQTTAKIDLLNLSLIFDEYCEKNKADRMITISKVGFHPLSTDYDFSSNQTNGHYQLRAKPRQMLKLDNCGTFSIDENGNKSISGTGSIEDCW